MGLGGLGCGIGPLLKNGKHLRKLKKHFISITKAAHKNAAFCFMKELKAKSKDKRTKSKDIRAMNQESRTKSEN